MQSFAFWYKSLDSTIKVEAKLNFNLWASCEFQADNENYLDIGILTKNTKNIKQLFLFVPFSVKSSNINDLGCKLKEKLPSALFNENLSVKSVQNKLIPLENEKNPSKNFYAYTLKDEIKINDGFDKAIYDNGTILSINLFDEKTNKSLFSNLEKEKDNIYFRFRIKNVDFKEILSSFEPTTKNFQNYFYTTYTIDFRFNNKRSLGDNLLQQINLYDRFVIESVHFLLITKTSVNLLTTEECSPRKLEKDIWNDYIDNENTDNLIAYHYKKSFKNKDTGEINYNNEAVDFFIKYDVGKSIFWKYFWLTILIGSAGSILGNVIWNLPSWVCKLIQCFQ